MNRSRIHRYGETVAVRRNKVTTRCGFHFSVCSWHKRLLFEMKVLICLRKLTNFALFVEDVSMQNEKRNSGECVNC